MQPATRFLARVKRNNKYVFQKVAIKRDRPVAPKDATSYYARYSNTRLDELPHRSEPILKGHMSLS